MSEKPILFQADMRAAIRAGRKTQTRRVHAKARYAVGDRLWVEEPGFGWRTPLFMPKAAARLWLRVTAVRAERLQAITDADAIAEGETGRSGFSELWDRINAKRGYPWAMNPLVWVYEFKKEEKP